RILREPLDAPRRELDRARDLAAADMRRRVRDVDARAQRAAAGREREPLPGAEQVVVGEIRPQAPALRFRPAAASPVAARLQALVELEHDVDDVVRAFDRTKAGVDVVDEGKIAQPAQRRIERGRLQNRAFELHELVAHGAIRRRAEALELDAADVDASRAFLRVRGTERDAGDEKRNELTTRPRS